MIGRSLAHYRILEKLGAGGMGEVYLADDRKLERRVAIKVLSPQAARDEEHLERFRREARAVAAVSHPNIVTVYSVEEVGGVHFFTMEHVDGQDLAGRLPPHGFGLDEVLLWAVPLADALTAAHAAGIVHRDLKPGNLMMTSHGLVKVLDFGLAKRISGAAAGPGRALTQVGALIGTMAYMAPEQIRGGEIDERTDLFAAGVLIYEMATGKHPFDGGDRGDLLTAILKGEAVPPSVVRAELGTALDGPVARCLEKDPADRYQTAAELRGALERVRLEAGQALTLVMPPTRADERRAARRPHVWNLPHLRNLNFSGRDEEIDELQRLFAETGGALPVVAVVGLGGVGKTQLVVEYAHRFANGFRTVWWLPAEEPAGLRSRFAALAKEVGLPLRQDIERTVAQVRDWLGINRDWLLVFDNAEEPAAVRRYLPPTGSGQVLVTSRNPAWRGMGRVLELDVWAADRAAEFLQRRTGDPSVEAAAELNRALGGLPLALEQAAAYIESSGQSLISYHRLYQQQRLRLLAREDSTGESSSSSVIATWDLSFRQVSRASPAAEQLLHLCAFLASDDIPLDLLREGEDLLPEALARTAHDELALDEALAALLRFSLVSRAESSLSVHRLVQAVVRRSLGAEARPWAERALRLLTAAFPAEGFREVAAWPRCSRLLPHALACLERVGDDPPAIAADLLDAVGCYLDGRGQYQEARTLLERSVAIEEAARGADHPRVADRLNSLGRVYDDLGRCEEALALFRRALAIDRAALGPDHPNVARRLNNVGKVLVDTGRWDDAEGLLEQALRIDEAAYGAEHPAVAMRLVNLGVIQARRGHPEPARRLFERALRIDEAAFGPDHPRVAFDLGNLGGVLQPLGDLEGSLDCQRRALRNLEANFGPEHPYLARPLRNLGEVLHMLGRQRSARAHLDRALEIEQAVWGGDHPGQAETLEMLGLLVSDQDQQDEARELFESSLRKFEEHLGPDHPDSVRLRNRLAELDPSG